MEMGAVAYLTMNQIAGEVLLDRHLYFKVAVPGQVGYAEGALAQHPPDEIAAV
jgi:hypothetical protein